MAPDLLVITVEHFGLSEPPAFEDLGENSSPDDAHLEGKWRNSNLSGVCPPTPSKRHEKKIIFDIMIW